MKIRVIIVLFALLLSAVTVGFLYYYSMKESAALVAVFCGIIGLMSVILFRQASNEIKKRKQVEDELRSINLGLQALFNAAPLPIIIIDAESTCILWNPAAEQVFGWTAKEVLGRTIPIVPDDRKGEFQSFLQKIFEDNTFKSVETQRLRRDGTLIDVALSTAPIHDADGTITASVGIYEDISDRKNTEEHTRLLASIIQNLPDAVCAVNTRGNTIFWNRGAEKMLGYRVEEVIGKPITETMPKEIAQQELSHCMTLLNQQDFFSGYESVRVAKDGRRVPVELTAVAIRDRNNEISNYASIMVDLTERKRAEGERLKGHMLESIGILAGGIAHDFNNLLTVIIGNISFAKTALQPGNKIYGRLDDAEKVCEMAAELSKRLITFATGGDPIRRTASVSDLLRDAATSLKDSNIHVEVDLPDALSLVSIDEGQMKQVFRNLVINAREAMPQGGKLAIQAVNLHISAHDSFPMREGDYVKITFKDTGAGIPADSLSKIFDPYYSTKNTYTQKGLGLGLAVSYSIIKKHNGLITTESVVGEGTTFTIYLNAAKTV